MQLKSFCASVASDEMAIEALLSTSLPSVARLRSLALVVGREVWATAAVASQPHEPSPPADPKRDHFSGYGPQRFANAFSAGDAPQNSGAPQTAGGAMPAAAETGDARHGFVGANELLWGFTDFLVDRGNAELRQAVLASWVTRTCDVAYLRIKLGGAGIDSMPVRHLFDGTCTVLGPSRLTIASPAALRAAVQKDLTAIGPELTTFGLQMAVRRWAWLKTQSVTDSFFKDSVGPAGRHAAMAGLAWAASHTLYHLRETSDLPSAFRRAMDDSLPPALRVGLVEKGVADAGRIKLLAETALEPFLRLITLGSGVAALSDAPDASFPTADVAARYAALAVAVSRVHGDSLLKGGEAEQIGSALAAGRLTLKALVPALIERCDAACAADRTPNNPKRVAARDLLDDLARLHTLVDRWQPAKRPLNREVAIAELARQAEMAMQFISEVIDVHALEQRQDIEKVQKVIAEIDATANALATGDYGGLALGTLNLASTLGYDRDRLKDFPVLRTITQLSEVALATDPKGVTAAFNKIAAPPGSFAQKGDASMRRTYGTINAYLGAAYGSESVCIPGGNCGERPSEATGGYAGVGLELGVRRPFGSHTLFRNVRNVGVFVQALDLGALTQWRIRHPTDASGTVAQNPEVGFSQVLSPGIFGVIGLGNWPFSVGAGVSRSPSLRSFTPTGKPATQVDVHHRWMLMAALDIPVFP